MNADEVRTIASGNARFTYLEAGTGVPLVLLHGVGSGARSWNHQVSGLSDAFRVIAWDAPGYGGSSTLAAPEPSAEDYANALCVFLAALGVDKLHLVGNSLGCVMASRFARLYPERILSLTLSSIATGHAHLPTVERERLRAMRLDDVAALGPQGMAEKRGPRLVGPNASAEAVRSVVETMGMIRPDGYTQAVRMLSNADTRADVREFADGLKVQFVYGDADVITPPEQNQSVHRERPSAPVHVFPGAGHAIYVEQPEAFNAMLRAFAAS